MEIGLRHGLIDTLAASGGDASSPPGLTAEELAVATDLDPFYVEVWCRAAVASEVVNEHSGERLVLAPHMATALLDKDSPAYVAGPLLAFECPEVFDRFSDRFATGQRTWWDESTPEFIDAVARSGRPFYVRLVPGGLQRVPDLGERLHHGARILDLACGAGFGLVRLAHTVPSWRVRGDWFDVLRRDRDGA